MYNKKYLKTENNVTTKKSTQKCSQCIYILVVSIASVYMKDKIYYSQVFLEKKIKFYY